MRKVSLFIAIGAIFAQSTCSSNGGAHLKGPSAGRGGEGGADLLLRATGRVKDGVVEVSGVLINQSSAPYWINIKPRFGFARANSHFWEIEIEAFDDAGLSLSLPCSLDHTAVQSAGFSVLSPSASLKFYAQLDGECYSLKSGSKIQIRLRYRSIPELSPPPPSGVRQVLVPVESLAVTVVLP